jgi:3',5'-cyclic AMP phosphodiesterase CpdA
MINSAIEKKLGEIAIWLDGVLSNNPSGWTVVSFHHPFYSAGKNRDEYNTRNAFGKLFDKYHVDLVLTGHDHAYSRSYKLVGGQKVRWNKKGTVYVISVSGPKMYETNSVYDSILAKTAVKTQLFQVISIDSKKLSYKSVTPVGEVIDSFILKKQ